MKTTKKYWKGLAQLNDDPIVEKLAQNEFVEDLPVDQFLGDKKNLSSTNSSRRDFLKFLGFSTAAATLAACETPVVKSIPYLVKPDEIIPGVANYYASTIYDGVLLKPIYKDDLLASNTTQNPKRFITSLGKIPNVLLSRAISNCDFLDSSSLSFK